MALFQIRKLSADIYLTFITTITSSVHFNGKRAQAYSNHYQQITKDMTCLLTCHLSKNKHTMQVQLCLKPRFHIYECVCDIAVFMCFEHPSQSHLLTYFSWEILSGHSNHMTRVIKLWIQLLAFAPITTWSDPFCRACGIILVLLHVFCRIHILRIWNPGLRQHTAYLILNGVVD